MARLAIASATSERWSVEARGLWPDERFVLRADQTLIHQRLGRVCKSSSPRRFAPHQLRHAHAVEMSREGIPVLVIQRQLGHSNLGVTSAYLRRTDSTKIIRTIHQRPPPVIPAANALRIDR